MSPLLVGIFTLLATANCDVKHVLQGQAHPPKFSNADASAINQLASINDGETMDFWWNKEESPLKDAYDHYKKCSKSGDCVPPSSINELVQVQCQGSSCTIKNPEGHEKVDLSNNPFFNGGVKADPGTHSNKEKMDLSKNPFFNGKIEGGLHSGNGDVIKDGAGFIGVQPAKPFSGKIACNQGGYVCVKKSQCVDGEVKHVSSARIGVSKLFFFLGISMFHGSKKPVL